MQVEPLKNGEFAGHISTFSLAFFSYCYNIKSSMLLSFGSINLSSPTARFVKN